MSEQVPGLDAEMREIEHGQMVPQNFIELLPYGGATAQYAYAVGYGLVSPQKAKVMKARIDDVESAVDEAGIHRHDIHSLQLAIMMGKSAARRDLVRLALPVYGILRRMGHSREELK